MVLLLGALVLDVLILAVGGYVMRRFPVFATAAATAAVIFVSTWIATGS